MIALWWSFIYQFYPVKEYFVVHRKRNLLDFVIVISTSQTKKTTNLVGEDVRNFRADGRLRVQSGFGGCWSLRFKKIPAHKVDFWLSNDSLPLLCKMRTFIDV